MKFLYPAFLFSLFAVAIPVIIHLFSFRRYKTVYFSHVGFLKDIKKESEKRSKLKQLLMLIARILTIIFLVFAFSQPYIPSKNQETTHSSEIIGVYIDNSFSMNALSEQGQLLEQARNKAVEIGQAYPAGTKFRLLTNDLLPKHQHIMNKEQFIREVTDIKISPAATPLSQIHNRFGLQVKMEKSDSQGTLYLLSDFQRNITDFENFNDEPVFSYLMPLIPGPVNNIYIDSCWVEVPAHGLNQEETIFVKIKNSSNEDYQNLPLKLFLNDSLKSITNFSVAAQNEITTTIKYTNTRSGIQTGRVEITDYPFTHDNTWYLSYFVEPKLKALAIYNSTPGSLEGLKYITALFEEDDYVEIETMDIQSLQVNRFSEKNTIFIINPDDFSSGFLNGLVSAVSNGSSVVLFPELTRQPANYNQFLSGFNAATVSGIDTAALEITGIDFHNRFFRNVFQERRENAMQPKIEGHLKFAENIRSGETSLLWFQNDDKALSMLPYEKGKVWVFSFPLNRQNETFAHDILFVPSIYNIVLNSLPHQQISYIAGREQTFFLPGNINADLSSPIEIENKEKNIKFIPGITISQQGYRLDLSGLTENAGYYFVKNKNEIIASLSFNYDRSESNLSCFSPDELKERVKLLNLEKASVLDNLKSNFSEILQEIHRGKQLWKWCLILALTFIVIEVLIARFWK